MPDVQAELEAALQEFNGEPMSAELSERVTARCTAILKEALIRGEPLTSIQLQLDVTGLVPTDKP